MNMRRNTRHLVVLDAATFGAIDLSPLKWGFDEVAIYSHTLPNQIAGRLTGADVVVTNKVVIDRRILAAAQNLKLICVAATGFNNVDVDAAAQNGVSVTNVPGYSTPSVVSHTFALAFHLLHRLDYHRRYSLDGHWCKSKIFTHMDAPYPEMGSQTWGIVGMGAIGRAVADVARGFGCPVVYHSTSGRNLDQPYPHLGLPRLLQKAHIVSIHAPLNKATRHLFDRDMLAHMRPEGLLLNTSRGPIVVAEDLACALEEKNIAGAGLDVLSQEPPPEDHPLLQLSDEAKTRLVVTPHIAGLSIQARQRLIDEVGHNIAAFRAGEPRNLVSSHKAG